MTVKLIQDAVVEKLKRGELEPGEAVEMMSRVSHLKVKYVPQGKEELKRQYMTDLKIRQQAISASVPFICQDFSPHYKLTQGLILVGAMSGKSKSTTAANVAAGFLRSNSDRRAIMINNEELSADAYNRIACIELGYSFDRFRQKKLGPSQIAEVEDQAKMIMDRVEVIAGRDRYDMCCLEHVQAVLEYAAEQKDVGLILLDYFQTVTYSEENPEMELYQVLKKLGDFFRDYGRRAVVPVVVFAQLKPKSEAADMQSRIQGDRTIYNHSFSCVEIIPDFETMQTLFVIHKDRFWGQAGKEITLEYKDGRYESVGV